MKGDPIKILLVEDNLEDARQIGEMLAEACDVPFHLECASRFSAGRDRLAKGGIDVVLLDLSLPDSRDLDTVAGVQDIASEGPILVLVGPDEEEFGIEAVKGGAQDYLIKGQVDCRSLVRAVRCAIERHRRQVELERIRQRDQEERERAQAGRHYQHYLAMSREEIPPEPPVVPSAEFLDRLVPDYREILVRYIRAVRTQEDRPSAEVYEFAKRMAAMRARARDVVRLHLRILNEYSERSLPVEQRAFSDDAQLLLTELIGQLLGIYRDASERQRRMNETRK